MGARVAEVEVAVGHAAEKFDDDGRLADDDVRQGSATRWRRSSPKCPPRSPPSAR